MSAVQVNELPTKLKGNNRLVIIIMLAVTNHLSTIRSATEAVHKHTANGLVLKIESYPLFNERPCSYSRLTTRRWRISELCLCVVDRSEPVLDCRSRLPVGESAKHIHYGCAFREVKICRR